MHSSRFYDGVVRDVFGQDVGDEGEGDDDAKEGEGDDEDEEGKEKEGFESLAPKKDGEEEEGEDLMEDEQQPQARTAYDHCSWNPW